MNDDEAEMGDFRTYIMTLHEEAKRDACMAKLRAITTMKYAEFEPLVLDAVRGIGLAVWEWLDHGPGLQLLDADAHSRLLQVHDRNRALFDAVIREGLPRRSPDG
jgi:hypothetical protein